MKDNERQSRAGHGINFPNKNLSVHASPAADLAPSRSRTFQENAEKLSRSSLFKETGREYELLLREIAIDSFQSPSLLRLI